MADRIYNNFKAEVPKANIDWEADDIRVILVMSDTTVDTENDAKVFVDDFTTLDECDGANYVRKALTGETVNKDDGNDRAELDADDPTDWTALGVGTRTTVGVLVIKHVNDDSDSPVIGFVEFAGAVTHDGTDFVIQWNVEGIFQLG